MGLNLKKLCRENGLNLKSLGDYDTNALKQYFKSQIVFDWRVNLVKELLLIREKSLVVQNIDESNINDILMYICTVVTIHTVRSKNIQNTLHLGIFNR